ncbi:MAG: S-layer homology domain-containing protein [Clostridia bacterium]|nr:S-layer homology domain-containing protein [Clostridia bacterium]
MKKISKAVALLLVLAVCLGVPVLAETAPVQVFLTGKSNVTPGETAEMILETVIGEGTDVQGIQIDFAFSENVPKEKECTIIQNTTGWQNSGVSEYNLLAFGEVNERKSTIVVKIAFVVPEDAADKEQYVLTPTAVYANKDEEKPATLNQKSFSVTVSGGVAAPDESEPEEVLPPQKEEEKPILIQPNNPAPKPDQEPTEGTKPEPQLWKNPFQDVKESDWFFENVRYAYENHLMSGTADKVFSPDDTLTRAMLVTVLHRMAGSPESQTFAFADVPRRQWYTKSVDWAAFNGIVNGVGENRFAPEDPITREQIAVLFYNYAKMQERLSEADADLLAFADGDQISQWAEIPMQWAVATGLISGKGNQMLDPGGNATRAETSAILQRFAEKINK